MEVTLEKKLELINKIKFFARMDEEDKNTMAGLCDFKQYAPGEPLIQEGSQTSDLLFIINGTVDIFVHGKHVVELAGGGHVFGGDQLRLPEARQCDGRGPDKGDGDGL